MIFNGAFNFFSDLEKTMNSSIQNYRRLNCLRSRFLRKFSQQKNYLDADECILVDENDNYKGKATKRDCHTWSKIKTGGMLHRAFSVFVFNEFNELLLQKRAQTKYTFPGMWSNSCCSHPLHVADEMESEPNSIGVRKAAQRKLVHELGVKKEDVPIDKISVIARILYKFQSNDEWGEHELDYILFLRANLVPLPNLDEVESTMYVSKIGLPLLLDKSKTDKRLQFTPWFLLMAGNYLFQWWDKLDHLEELADNKKIYKPV